MTDVVELDPMHPGPENVEPTDDGECEYDCDRDAEYEITIEGVTFGACRSCITMNLPSVSDRLNRGAE